MAITKKPQYDITTYNRNGKPVKAKKPPIPCEHKFEHGKKFLSEYNADYCDLIIEHGKKGLYVEGFCGKYNISVDAMMEWLSATSHEYDDFKVSFKISISAALHYWNEELIHALSNMETCGEKVSHIKSILSDIMKYTPKSLRDMQFNNLRTKTQTELAHEKDIEVQNEFVDAIKGKMTNTDA